MKILTTDIHYLIGWTMFYRFKMNILITGASGFLGQHLLKQLSFNDIKLLGRARTNDIEVDLAKEIPKINNKFDIVIHAAGKAHSLPKTEQQSQEFYDVNVTGTANL